MPPPTPLLAHGSVSSQPVMMVCLDLLAALTYSPIPCTPAVSFHEVPASLPCFLAAAGQLTKCFVSCPAAADFDFGTHQFDGYRGKRDERQH